MRYFIVLLLLSLSFDVTFAASFEKAIWIPYWRKTDGASNCFLFCFFKSSLGESVRKGGGGPPPPGFYRVMILGN
jgi:hypothetical protein